MIQGYRHRSDVSRIIDMKMKRIAAAALAIAVCLGATALPADAQETLGEKTSRVWNKTKAKTKEVTRKTVRKTKQVANRVESAVREPDADATKVQVRVTDRGVQMPKNLKSGKTAFVVTNTGSEKHDFEITGEGLEKSFWFDLAPNETKTMQVELKPGSYKAACEEHRGKEPSVQLAVK